MRALTRWNNFGPLWGELQKFQGTWQLVSAETDGKSAPDEQVKKTRVVIEGGKHTVHVGDTMVVEADVFTDGHDALACMLGFRHAGESDWTEVPMTALPNDRWRGQFRLEPVQLQVAVLQTQ